MEKFFRDLRNWEDYSTLEVEVKRGSGGWNNSLYKLPTKCHFRGVMRKKFKGISNLKFFYFHGVIEEQDSSFKRR